MLPTVVITSAVPWDGITARPHHLARQLALRGWPVLYVEPPVTLLGPLKNRSLRSRMLPKNPVTQVETHAGTPIRVLHPVFVFPFHHVLRTVNRLNQRLIAGQIRQNTEGDIVLFSNLPDSVDMIPWLHPIATFYDCVDDHGAFGGLTNVETINLMECDMAFASRAIFATADALAERMAEYHRDVYLVPNAVELEHFAKTKDALVHAELQAIKGPRVGFVGGIGSWLDFELIRNLATIRSQVQFILIGPIETDVSAVESLPNVHLLGRRPYAELPGYLAAFDATLYPFANSKLTESVNPVKVYEYLAAEREVLATPTRELHKFADYVWLIHNAEEGAQALDRILSGERRSSPESRASFLREQTWGARAEIIDNVLTQHIPQA